jgi:hypothetical protein
LKVCSKNHGSVMLMTTSTESVNRRTMLDPGRQN